MSTSAYIAIAILIFFTIWIWYELKHPLEKERIMNTKKHKLRIVKIHKMSYFGEEYDNYRVERKFLWFWINYFSGYEIFLSLEEAENAIKRSEFTQTKELVKEY